MIPVYWFCPNGHILGMVEKNNSRSTLRVYRDAVFPGAESDPLLASEITGDAIIYCSLCGAARAWRYIDPDSRRLLNRRQKT